MVTTGGIENGIRATLNIHEAPHLSPYHDLFVCFVALCPKSTAMVMAERSVYLTTLFPGQA